MAANPKANSRKIGLREIRALEPNTQIFDAGPGSVPAFGARRRAGVGVSYFVMFRTESGRLRLFTIGQHGAPWTPDTARYKALAVLAEVKVRGVDPAAERRTRREAATVNDLCDAYWTDAETGRVLTRRGAAKKASTLLSDKGRIVKHIKPLLGPLKVTAVTRQDVKTAMNAIAEGKTAARTTTGKKRGLSNVRGGAGVARRTIGLLGAIFTYAVDHGMRADNPVRGVQRTADGKRERRLSDAEYAALGTALRQATKTNQWPPGVAVMRFLTLSGWRAGEVIGLRWSEVDLFRRTATLADTKTGKSIRPLSVAACDVLTGLTRADDLVFPASRGAGCMTGFRSVFDRIAAMGGLPVATRRMMPSLPDPRVPYAIRGKVAPKAMAAAGLITPHALRHSFASLAGDLGFSEATIGSLIGHKGHSITSQYMHSADAVLLAAADAIARRTMELMGEAQSADVASLRVVPQPDGSV